MPLVHSSIRPSCERSLESNDGSEPNIHISFRQQETPSGWKCEIWQYIRTPCLEMCDMKWDEESWIVRVFCAAPDIPTCCTILGIAAHAIHRSHSLSQI